MTQAERKKQLESDIAINVERCAKARSENDWGRVRFFNEKIRDLKSTLRLLPEIYALKSKIAKADK